MNDYSQKYLQKYLSILPSLNRNKDNTKLSAFSRRIYQNINAFEFFPEFIDDKKEEQIRLVVFIFFQNNSIYNGSINFAQACKKINKNFPTVDNVFQRILLKKNFSDAHLDIRRLGVMLAKKNVLFDGNKFIKDIIYFNEITKKEWAKNFWS